MNSVFAGQKAVLATQHAKERAIQAPFLQHLQLNVIVPANLDTDCLGTFSGEIPRLHSPLETVISKAHLGMNALNLPLGLANEGSFGPHPNLPLTVFDHEILVFVNQNENYWVKEELFSPHTNFSRFEFFRLQDIAHPAFQNFLTKALFPSHSLIIRPVEQEFSSLIYKGINQFEQLKTIIKQSFENYKIETLIIETDMRAHQNPIRMKTIEQLALKMTDRLQSLCPSCQAPGFGRIQLHKGLACERCKTPTQLVIHETLGCASCDYQENKPRKDGLQFASMMYCDACNP